MSLLLLVDLLDELCSGVPVLGAPDIRADLSADYLSAAWALLVLPVGLGVLVESPILVWSDRWKRTRVVAVALAAEAALILAASRAESSWMLGLALGVWGVGAGISNGAATSALMAGFPDERERLLTRGALLGSLGDALAPGLVVVTLALGGSWREALVVMAVLYALHAALVWATPIEAEGPVEDDEAEPEPLWVSLRAGLARPGLVRWLIAMMSCTLLDEILVAFGSLYLREALGATPAHQGAAFTAFAVGCAVGLALSERALPTLGADRVLRVSASCCLLAFGLWLLLGSTALSIPLLALVGLGTGPLYPLTQARAYAAYPERPGVVSALASAFAPVEVAAPLLIGWAAQRWGLAPALALLALQPVIVLLALRRPHVGDDRQ